MRPVPIGLLLLTAGLVALIAFELQGEADRARPVERGASAPTEIPDSPALPEPVLGPLSGMDQTAARPLFRRDRRPPPIAPVIEAPKMPEPAKPPKAVTAPVSEPAPVFRHALSAIVIADGEAFAYLRKADETDLARLRRGETIDGWRLEEVRPDSVVLTHGPTRTEVELRPPQPSAQPGLPAAARDGVRPPDRAPPPARAPASRPQNGGAAAGNVRPDSIDADPAPRSPRASRPGAAPRISGTRAAPLRADPWDEPLSPRAVPPAGSHAGEHGTGCAASRDSGWMPRRG